MTSLRGVAAILVVIFHLRTRFGTAINLDQWTPFFANGYLWVDFFFVLSGFVIALAYGERFSRNAGPAEYRRFLTRRFARIYPLHLFTLLCFVPTEAVKYFVHTAANPPFSRNSPAAFVANLFLVQAWGVLPYETWNWPSWSISVELAAYLAFPVLVLLIWRVRDLRWVPPLMILLIAMLALSGAIGATTGIAIVRCMISFALGVLIYRLYAAAPGTVRRWLGSNASLLAALAATVIMLHLAANGALVVGVFAWIVAAASMNAGAVGRALAFPPLYFLGTVSYSIYLMQGLVIRVWQAAFQVGFHGMIAPAPAYAILAALVLATVALGAAAYRVVEIPGRRLIGRYSANIRSAAPNAQPAFGKP